jgi:hypothetical protein
MTPRGDRRKIPSRGRLGNAQAAANLRNRHEAIAADKRPKLLAAAIYNLEGYPHGINSNLPI